MTDLFCGAGGSSTGAVAIPGIEVRVASNHWDLAIETHNTNHPETDHVCADISQIDPRLFPRTDLLWASPECTNHSIAKGRRRADRQPDLFGEVLPDDAAERSRATMWDVPRFAEAHRYEAVIVENVVDAYFWEPFRAWLIAMDSLGYDHDIVFLNSMHAQAFGPGAPQSRDRMYVVFWRKGNQRPDVDRVTSPAAVCPEHGEVRARQAFKRPDRRWGRYRQQYVYMCSSAGCARVVEPVFRPAAEIIDWELRGQRIGDRARPLAEKTLARIKAGIERYWGPFITEHRHEYRVRDIGRPMQTVTASGNHFGLVTTYYGNGSTKPVWQALDTVTTVERHALLNNPQPDIDDVLFRMLEPHEISRAMDFPHDYVILGNRRERVRQAGNAVTPPAARDLVGVVAESLGVSA